MSGGERKQELMGEIERRLAKWVRPEPKVKKGYLSLYSRLASSAAEGAIIKTRF
jgi:dihydroxy-acid dehydratase